MPLSSTVAKDRQRAVTGGAKRQYLTVKLVLATLEVNVKLEWAVVVLLDSEEVATVVDLVWELVHEGRIWIISGGV